MWIRIHLTSACILLTLASGAPAPAQDAPAGGSAPPAARGPRTRAAPDKPPAAAPAVTLVTRLTMPQRPGAEVTTRTRFSGRWAVGFDADDDAIVVYDLQGGSWFDWANRKWVTRKDAEAWAGASRQRSTASATRRDVPEEARRMLSATMDPNFKVSRAGGRLTLSNELLTYEVAPKPLPPGLAAAFQAQQQLGAYFQAMTDRNLPPYPLLAVLKELDADKAFPQRMELTIRVRGTEQKLVTAMEIEAAAAGHDDKIADALALAGGPPPDAAGESHGGEPAAGQPSDNGADKPGADPPPF